jgi:hypothetical protein
MRRRFTPFVAAWIRLVLAAAAVVALAAGNAHGAPAAGGGMLADPIGDANGGADISSVEFEASDDGFLTFRVLLASPLAASQGIELNVDTIDGGGGFLGLPGGFGYDFGASYAGGTCGRYRFIGGAGGARGLDPASLACREDGNVIVLRIAAADFTAGATMRIIVSTTHVADSRRFYDDHAPDCGPWTVALAGPASQNDCSAEPPPAEDTPAGPLVKTFQDTLSKKTRKRSHAVALPDDVLSATLTVTAETGGAQVDVTAIRLPDAQLQIRKTHTRHSVRARIGGLLPGTLRFTIVARRLTHTTRVETRLVVSRG